MKKYGFFTGLTLGLGVITAIAVGKYVIASTKTKSAINFTTMRMVDVDKDFARCTVRNALNRKISIEVIESKFTSGTYYVEPQTRAMFSCGDKLAIHVAGEVERLQLSQPITVHSRERIKEREI
jgi:hypothetical protein